MIGTFLTDDWDERIDAVSRGVLGLTVACARCHDHKFDPITTKDYYALMGVFASTVRAERPMFPVDTADRAANSCGCSASCSIWRIRSTCSANEGTTFTDGAEKAVKWKAEMEALKARAATSLAKYPQLIQSLDKYWNPPRRAAAPPPPPPPAAGAAAQAPPPQPRLRNRRGRGARVDRPVHERRVRGGAIR